jgi:hypothetical protein
MRVSVILPLIIIFGCAASRKSEDHLIKVTELNYGISKTDEPLKATMDASPSGTHSLADNFSITKKTDRVPAIPGQQFGTEYIIKTKRAEVVTLEQVWIFPQEIKDDKGNVFTEVRYPMHKQTNEKSYSNYTLEKNFEIVKGKWTFIMLHEGKEIFRRDFYLE